MSAVRPASFLSFLLDRLLQYENVDEDSSGEQDRWGATRSRRAGVLSPVACPPAAVPHEHLLSVCVVGTDFGGTVVVR